MGLINRFETDHDITLGDHLAIERTRLSNERTLFSYIRTSLYLLTAGIGILEIDSMWHLRWLGWVCTSFSAVILFLGFYRFTLMKKHLKSFFREHPE